MSEKAKPMTLTQKILADHARRAHAPVGRRPATCCGSRWTGPSPASWPGTAWTAPTRCSGRPALHDKDRFFLAVDHTVDPVTLADDARTQKLVQLSRDFAKESGIRHFYDANETILHTKFYRDLVQPGEVVLGADSPHLARTAAWARSPSASAARTSPPPWCWARAGSRCPRPSPSSTSGALPFGIGGKDVILETLGSLKRNTVAMERIGGVPRARRRSASPPTCASPSPT